MKPSFLLLATAALLLQLSACVTTDRESGSSTKDPRTTYVPPAPSERSRLTNNSVLNTVRATHAFSDPNSQDNFVLQLRGTRVLNSRAHLIVTNSAGDTLRHEVLPAHALLSEKVLTDPAAATMREKEIAILKSMNNFFSPKNFVQPAVPASAEQPAEVDTQIWKALREDPATVAFDYTGAGGAERRLAYIRKLGKTVVISQ
ncbi:hypothetical protein GCM10023185_24440 [Hymenobacter saemangeumensis]|uniref:Uncharacterized protein n=1 Tax=Hymenobacter saemangeumensis TaxID=1084522 RepID=A0ABP8IH46_9BACT